MIFRSQFMDRIYILLWYSHGHLLLECLECERTRSSTRFCLMWAPSLQSLAFPMLSTSLFSSNGSIYDQAAVFGSTGLLNQTALGEVGLPALTGQ